MVTRIVAQKVSKGVGQTLRVDNRPGANSILGMASEKRVAVALEIPTLVLVPRLRGNDSVLYVSPYHTQIKPQE